MILNQVLESKLKNLPDNPGVYLMKDASGQIIYVGKARVLKNRVRQYFHSSRKADKVEAMVSHIEDLDYIMTNSEMDALMLESNLIKKYKPQYNILLKDDKSYPYLRVNLKEKYPRITITRRSALLWAVHDHECARRAGNCPVRISAPQL